jgi:hypothetical protein
MLETKVMHEKRRLWSNGDSEHESFSNVALSNIQEGGWKDPDIKQGQHYDNQIESQWKITCDKARSTCQIITVR